LTVLPLLLGWLWASSFVQLLVVGALLGVAGASFAVALTMAGRWYRVEQQGLVLGVVGAGNSGAALAMILSPRIVASATWNDVFGLSMVPLAVAFVAVALLARDAPVPSSASPLRATLTSLKQRDTAWYCLFYATTFGGFVGIMGFLTIFLRDQYEIDPIHAGIVAALCALGGSLARPVGGWLADLYGGTSILFLVYVGLGVLGLRMSYIPHLEVALVSLILMLALMGIGNGAIFQLMARRSPEPFGTSAGIVGAAGGLGGFLIPLLIGHSQDWLGRFGPGFFVVGLGSLLASGLVLQVSRHGHWEASRSTNLSASVPRREVEVISST
jgi:NNP family nitrate/nitrite transporter-like MFS transporter